MDTPLNHTGSQLTTLNSCSDHCGAPGHSRKGGISVSRTQTLTTSAEAACPLRPAPQDFPFRWKEQQPVSLVCCHGAGNS